MFVFFLLLLLLLLLFFSAQYFDWFGDEALGWVVLLVLLAALVASLYALVAAFRHRRRLAASFRFRWRRLRGSGGGDLASNDETYAAVAVNEREASLAVGGGLFDLAIYAVAKEEEEGASGVGAAAAAAPAVGAAAPAVSMAVENEDWRGGVMVMGDEVAAASASRRRPGDALPPLPPVFPPVPASQQSVMGRLGDLVGRAAREADGVEGWSERETKM